ncbi:hypothetical protein ADEAN_000233700 [Angomonas deanei]|uniref:Uncharacterized protein n=1 Tax=Angomonas deanei TaxID=59799 RepID=A0A7G2C710_9TRYP|nr:hypothetical protein ADEAN_000233700 [Angomonas deanei]
MQLGRQAAADSKCLVLFPFTVLKELATSAKQTSESVLSFDVDLQESFKKEEQLAGTRLRSLCTLLSSEGPHCRRRVLHFTECLLAGFFVCGDTSGKLSSLHTSENSNDELLAILVMLRSLAAPETEVHLCCDDPELLQMVVDSGDAFRGGSVVLLSSSSPEEMQDFSTGLINDNPVLDLGLDFEPKLAVTADLKATSEEGKKLEEISTGNSPAAKQDTTSPWLEMLNEADDGESFPAPTTTMVSAPETEMTTTPHEEDHHPLEVDLMNVYQSPHDVIPVGQKMKEAAEMGTVFDEFDVLNPEDLELMEANEAARRSPLSLEGNTGKKRRRSLLEKEYLQNRGLSNKERYQTARTLSNMSGARVPFNLRYNVVEANVNHPKNRELKKSYEAGLQKSAVFIRRKTCLDGHSQNGTNE